MAEFDAAAFGGVDISGDGGVYKKILTAGDPAKGSPPSGAHVTVHYVGTLLDGTKFDSSRDRPGFFNFDVGVGRVIKGWDLGIMSMTKGEKAMLACRADYAYGDNGSPPKIPGGATLLFEVELFSWKRDPKSMSADEAMKEAEEQKAEGTALYKATSYEEALASYDQAAEFAESAAASPEKKALLLSCRLNAASCALKLQEYKRAVGYCDQALAHDENSVKALFRRGSAKMAMGEYEAAKADLRKASGFDPTSKEVRDAFAKCVKLEAEAKKKEKGMYSKMFG